MCYKSFFPHNFGAICQRWPTSSSSPVKRRAESVNGIYFPRSFRSPAIQFGAETLRPKAARSQKQVKRLALCFDLIWAALDGWLLQFFSPPPSPWGDASEGVCVRRDKLMSRKTNLATIKKLTNKTLFDFKPLYLIFFFFYSRYSYTQIIFSRKLVEQR